MLGAVIGSREGNKGIFIFDDLAVTSLVFIRNDAAIELSAERTRCRT